MEKATRLGQSKRRPASILEYRPDLFEKECHKVLSIAKVCIIGSAS